MSVLATHLHMHLHTITFTDSWHCNAATQQLGIPAQLQAVTQQLMGSFVM
jgi:hypothetical protein